MKKCILFVIALGVGLTASGSPVVVNLGSASSFGLLGGTISNTGTSVVTGNVGVGNSSGTITGFNPTGTTVNGSVIAPGNTLSNNAYTDFMSAFTSAQLLVSSQTYSDLSVSRTFIGNNVYTFTQTNVSTVTGINLTFDAQNDPSATFVLRIAGAFTENGALTFTLQNQAQANHIFWIVGTDATISTGSSGPIDFSGNILAGQSFTMSAGSGGSGVLAGTINGCVFAGTANTLAGTTNVGGCSSSNTSTPEPRLAGAAGLLILLSAVAWHKRNA